MATKKAGGVSKNGRDSNSKSLGIKVYPFKKVSSGEILLLGPKKGINSGQGTSFSKNYSIVSNNNLGGVVYFYKSKKFKKKYILVV